MTIFSNNNNDNRNNIHEKLCVSDFLKTSAFVMLINISAKLTQVQITNSMNVVPKFCLS